jgi:hypothetical protein
VGLLTNETADGAVSAGLAVPLADPVATALGVNWVVWLTAVPAHVSDDGSHEPVNPVMVGVIVPE